MRWKQGSEGVPLGLDQAPRRLDDLGKAARELEIAERIRGKPFEVVEFLVQDWLVGDPAGRERHNEVMAAAGVPRQHLAPAGQSRDLYSEPGFLVDLAKQGGMQGFTEFDPAARQGVKALGWRTRPPHQQNLAVA